MICIVTSFWQILSELYHQITVLVPKRFPLTFSEFTLKEFEIMRVLVCTLVTLCLFAPIGA
jgi:hypothetical protein